VNFVMMQLQLCPVFSLGTRTHYFGRTLLHGGVGYRVTGRVSPLSLLLETILCGNKDDVIEDTLTKPGETEHLHI
jgi:hypothetical protein